MKKVNISIPEQLVQTFEKNQHIIENLVELQLIEIKEGLCSAISPLDSVKAITRTNADVWNWETLEKEIFLGSIKETV